MSLEDRLRDIVGPSHLLVAADLRAPYERDWTRRFGGHARAVVRPGDAGEVAAAISACASEGVSVVPQGGNTGLVGGSVPRGGEVVMSLRRLDQLETPDEQAGQMTAGAGVTLAALQARAAAADLAFGIDFGARDSATVGGMVATNAGGTQVMRYGSMRAQVVGFEVVLADGSVIRDLAGLSKDNTGYHLPGLLCGSEGTLGVITRARLRLHPRLAHRTTALLALDDVATAVRACARLRRDLGNLEAAELMLADGLAMAAKHTGVAVPFEPANAYLLVECAAREDPTDALARAVAALDGVRDAAVAVERGDRERLWTLRHGHTEAISAAGIPHKMDVAVPLDRVADLCAQAPERVRACAPDARTVLFGHAGDGNVHVNVLGPPPADPSVDEAVLALAVELGGSVSAEHGIGVAKVGWLARQRGEAAVAAMRSIKDALDPTGVLNPGVLLPATPTRGR